MRYGGIVELMLLPPCGASFANAVKLNRMGRNRVLRYLHGLPRDRFLDGHVEIADRFAFFAYEMIVKPRDRVEVLNAVPEIAAGNTPLLYQYTDIPVHVPHACRFYFSFQRFMDHLRGGMLRARLYELEYPFALRAVSPWRFHNSNNS
jgi:hypothetical protein